MVKISFLGVAIVGSLGFIIRVLFLFFNLLPQTGQAGTAGAAP
jgi:preprotein translocase subunit Sss1